MLRTKPRPPARFARRVSALRASIAGAHMTGPQLTSANKRSFRQPLRHANTATVPVFVLHTSPEIRDAALSKFVVMLPSFNLPGLLISTR